MIAEKEVFKMVTGTGLIDFSDCRKTNKAYGGADGRKFSIRYNQKTDAVRLAPLWNQGSSLYPQIDEITMDAVLHEQDELLHRIYVFPNSAIRYRGRKISYYKLLSSNALPFVQLP